MLSPVVSRLLTRAQRELQSGDADAAVRTINDVLALVPDNAEANALMGIGVQMRGDHARALAHPRKALAACHDDSRLHMALGIAQFESGEAEAVVASLWRTCDLDREWRPPGTTLATR